MVNFTGRYARYHERVSYYFHTFFIEKFQKFLIAPSPKASRIINIELECYELNNLDNI